MPNEQGMVFAREINALYMEVAKEGKINLDMMYLTLVECLLSHQNQQE